MKPNSPDDRFSDPEAALDEFFRVREMAPADFAERTLEAARAKQRRARVIRFTALSSGLAASFFLLLGLALWRPAADQPGLAALPAAAPEPSTPPEAQMAGDEFAPASAEELTAALYAAFSPDDVVFYAQARTLEALLAETVSLSEEENELTLDFLILLAQN